MRLFALLVVVVAVVACGGGGSKPAAKPGPTSIADPIPQTPGPDCATVATHISTVIGAERPNKQDEIRTQVETRCTTDKWSDDARSCFAGAENDAEFEGCETKLTPAQVKAIKAMRPADDGAAESMSAPKGDSSTKSRGTRGPKRNSDPQEGGESSADPEEGGE